MERTVTEYDGYEIDFPYLNKELTDEEEKERLEKLKKAQAEARKMLEELL